MTSRLELAPWIITIGGPAASRGPMSTTWRAPPATSIILPCAGYARSQQENAGLRDQRQHHQHRHDNHHHH